MRGCRSTCRVPGGSILIRPIARSVTATLFASLSPGLPGWCCRCGDPLSAPPPPSSAWTSPSPSQKKIVRPRSKWLNRAYRRTPLRIIGYLLASLLPLYKPMVSGYYKPIYSSAEIHCAEPMLLSRNPCSHQYGEQGLMIPLDFRHVRARSRIGKNNLPGGPGPQGPTHPLEAPGGFRQGLPRRGPLEPASVEVLDEGQPPQTQSETGQVHKAQEGQRRRARVVPNPPWCFKSRMVSAIEKRAPSISMLWSADSARSVLTKTSGS